MAWTRSGDLMVMVVLGGMGTLFGPVLGRGRLSRAGGIPVGVDAASGMIVRARRLC